jgi:hypothetical protein
MHRLQVSMKTPLPPTRCRLDDALARPFPDRLQFVLGTESGMITSIVRAVQKRLAASGRADVAVEVVFPVSPEAITTDRQEGSALPKVGDAWEPATGSRVWGCVACVLKRRKLPIPPAHPCACGRPMGPKDHKDPPLSPLPAACSSPVIWPWCPAQRAARAALSPAAVPAAHT